ARQPAPPDVAMKTPRQQETAVAAAIGLGEAHYGAGAENGLPGTNFLQVCCAALNWFVLGSTPAFLPMTSAPPGFGSGNLDTPCERMHSANLSIACWVFACCWAVGLPSGCSLRHALAAALNCCELVSTPVSLSLLRPVIKIFPLLPRSST